MDEYSVWIDETGKIVSFHEIDNGELIYFDQREVFLTYLSTLHAGLSVPVGLFGLQDISSTREDFKVL